MCHENQFINSIKECLSKQFHNIEDYELEMEGKTKYREGLICDVHYINLIDKRHRNRNFHLVIKCLKRRLNAEYNPTKGLFEKEIFIYTKVYPEFRSLEDGKHCNSSFGGLAECYGCSSEEGREMIILENLKSEGYDIKPRGKPFTLEETKLVLTEMAKWHGYSFVLKDQKPAVFKDLTRDKTNVFEKFSNHTNLSKLFHDSYLRGLRGLQGVIDENVLNTYKGLKERFYDLLHCIADDDMEYSVISHGDYWNHNLLLKYEDGDSLERKPVDVRVIDWQCSSVTVPVYDVAHFLYSTASKQQFDNLRSILDTYYESLASFIRHLGSDPDKLYPLVTFKQHWNKYSGHGLVLTPLQLDIWLCKDADNEPEGNDEKPFEEMFLDHRASDEEEYVRRLSEGELGQALKEMEIDNAPGVDLVSAEVLMNVDDDVQEILYTLIHDEGKPPNENCSIMSSNSV